MGKLIAVQGCSVAYSISGGTCSISGTISPGDAKIAVEGNKAYKEKLTINVTSGSCTLLTPPPGAQNPQGTMYMGGSLTIDGTSQKTKTEGESLVLEGDQGSQSFTFLFPQISGPSPISVDIEITAKVDDPGQNVVNVT